MYLALEAILDDGDEVIVPTPYFTIYKTQIELARGKIVELDTLRKNTGRLTLIVLRAVLHRKQR